MGKTLSKTVDNIKTDLQLGLEGVCCFHFAEDKFPWLAAVPPVVKLRF